MATRDPLPAVPQGITFLPPELRPSQPDFYVWWTGTLGQAEWLITHAASLAGRALPKQVPHDLNALPARLRPLLALEQPDLLVSTTTGEPLLSIEITEQQEFGSNSQQRMARFWSAVACGVPSAYILPIEGYQIERASAAEAQILDEPNPSLRALRLFIAALPRATSLPRLNAARLWAQGIRTPENLIGAIEHGTLQLDRSAVRNARKVAALQAALRRYVKQDSSDPVRHIEAVPYQEYLHKIDGEVYKAYLRKPGETTSMVLTWLAICSKVTRTYPFKAPSDLSVLFETSGLLHTIEDRKHPHLAFRNLPPGPGDGPVVHRRTGKDEISLFVDFTSSVVSGTTEVDLARDLFTAPGEYFDADIETQWTKPVHSLADLTASGSGDFLASDAAASDLLRWADPRLNTAPHVLPSAGAHVFKIYCSSPSRGLADPYSGMLAVRDVLFCRDTTQVHNLAAFDRKKGLIFFVEMRGEAASRHPFAFELINRTYRRLRPEGTATSPQDRVIELLEHSRAEDIPKDLRSHLAFSDLIVVKRTSGADSSVEAVEGLPALLRSGRITPQAAFIRSLTLDH